jgi:hypothetical protein
MSKANLTRRRFGASTVTAIAGGLSITKPGLAAAVGAGVKQADLPDLTIP